MCYPLDTKFIDVNIKNVIIFLILSIYSLAQKRNIWSNVRLIVIPFYLCLLLVGIQALFDTQVNNSPDHRCGCQCIVTNEDGKCERKSCGLQYSSQIQAFFCAFPNPPSLLPLLQIPHPESRYVDRAHDSCRRIGSCPVTILVTGNNPSLGASMSLSLIDLLQYFIKIPRIFYDIFVSSQTNLHFLALSRNLLSTSFTATSDLFLRNLAYNVLASSSLLEFQLLPLLSSLYLS